MQYVFAVSSLCMFVPVAFHLDLDTEQTGGCKPFSIYYSSVCIEDFKGMKNMTVSSRKA